MEEIINKTHLSLESGFNKKINQLSVDGPRRRGEVFLQNLVHLSLSPKQHQSSPIITKSKFLSLTPPK